MILKSSASQIRFLKTIEKNNVEDLFETTFHFMISSSEFLGQEAREILSEVYGWSTEGFDTSDVGACQHRQTN